MPPLEAVFELSLWLGLRPSQAHPEKIVLGLSLNSKAFWGVPYRVFTEELGAKAWMLWIPATF